MDAVALQTIPIEAVNKATILLNVEESIKDVLGAIAKNRQICGKNKQTGEITWSIDIDAERFKELPNSTTGVIIYYVVKGLKEDFNIEFENQPKSLKMRGGSAFDKKVAGRKRLITKAQKNELIARTNLSYYENDIASGIMSIEDAMNEIKKAFLDKKYYEDAGLVLPANKTKGPYWKNDLNE